MIHVLAAGCQVTYVNSTDIFTVWPVQKQNGFSNENYAIDYSKCTTTLPETMTRKFNTRVPQYA